MLRNYEINAWSKTDQLHLLWKFVECFYVYVPHTILILLSHLYLKFHQSHFEGIEIVVSIYWAKILAIAPPKDKWTSIFLDGSP